MLSHFYQTEVCQLVTFYLTLYNIKALLVLVMFCGLKMEYRKCMSTHRDVLTRQYQNVETGNMGNIGSF